MLDMLSRLRTKLGTAPHNWASADIEKFIADFEQNQSALTKFDNGGLDVEVWKKFKDLDGARAWVRKSEALQERIKTQIAAGKFTDADVDKLKDYYSGHLSKSDVTTYPMTSPSTGQYYDDFGHPDFIKSVLEIREKDGTLGRPVYEPSGRITGNRATDARLANEEMAKRFNPDDFEYVTGSNVCKIRDSKTGEMVPHTWHHHQDGKTMMAVPKSIHDASNASHIGGVQVKNAEIIGFFESPVF